MRLLTFNCMISLYLFSVHVNRENADQFVYDVRYLNSWRLSSFIYNVVFSDKEPYLQNTHILIIANSPMPQHLKFLKLAFWTVTGVYQDLLQLLRENENIGNQGVKLDRHMECNSKIVAVTIFIYVISLLMYFNNYLLAFKKFHLIHCLTGFMPTGMCWSFF